MKTKNNGDQRLESCQLLPCLHEKERNKSQKQSEGSPEFVLEISLAVGWDFRDVALCCFCSPGETYSVPDCPTHVFKNSCWRYSLFIQHFCHQEAHLTAI